MPLGALLPRLLLIRVRRCACCCVCACATTGLAVTETTIENNNASLWQYVQPRTVLDWARNMVANRLAVNGSNWADIFSRENSG